MRMVLAAVGVLVLWLWADACLADALAAAALPSAADIVVDTEAVLP